MTADGSSTMYLWSWPRDEPAEQLAFRTTGGGLLAVFGSGPDIRLVIGPGPGPSSVVVLPGDLGGGAGPTAQFGRDARAAAFGGIVQGDTLVTLVPFAGKVPGGLPAGREAYVFSGGLLHPGLDPEKLAEMTPIALLPGQELMGAAGPEGGWLALLGGFQLQDVGAFGFNPQVGSGLVIDLVSPTRTPAQFSLVATASVLEPELDNGDLAPTFTGVAQDPERPGSLIVGNEAADAEITGPPGTTVWWSTRGDSGVLTIGPDGVARIRLIEPAGPDAPDGLGATVNIWVLTPAGHAYSGTWRIRVYRQPPDLGIDEVPPLVDFTPTLAGVTLPGTTVTINGKRVVVRFDGTFEVPIEVGIVPTELRIVAVDSVGNRTERVVSRVGPVDYRQLPWVPIAIVLTIGAGVILFLRKPDPGPSRRRPDDDATFEEIGG